MPLDSLIIQVVTSVMLEGFPKINFGAYVPNQYTCPELLFHTSVTMTLSWKHDLESSPQNCRLGRRSFTLLFITLVVPVVPYSPQYSTSWFSMHKQQLLVVPGSSGVCETVRVTVTHSLIIQFSFVILESSASVAGLALSCLTSE